MRENGMVILASLLLSILQAHPAIQALYFIVGTGNQEYHTHALPFFVALYFFFGRFHLPSLGFVYAGTYLTLLVTDLADLAFRWHGDTDRLPLMMYFDAIGGGGLWDGLLHLPLLSVLLAWLTRAELRKGKRYKWMLRHQPSVQ